MKAKTKTDSLTKVNTWLPIFSGFYETIWDTDFDEEQELEYINEECKKKNLAPVTWEDVQWDYEGYHQNVAKGITKHVGAELEKLGLISKITFQELRSPREYNFRNDSINVEIALSEANRSAIIAYLYKHKEAFATYVEDRYSSGSGFISSYPSAVNLWLYNEELLDHEHQLGSVLNFILLNENGEDYEDQICDRMKGNGYTLDVINFEELTEVK